MRIVGIETSSRRGSIALLEDSRCVACVEHEQPNSHAELILTLLGQVLASAGWSKSSLDRIAVGTGPGTFVGLRVGIALAEGLSLGLSRPLLGVSSLSAMLRAIPRELARPHLALLDARRDELFVAAEASDGQPLIRPCALSPQGLRAELAKLGWQPRRSTEPNGAEISVVGEVVGQNAALQELGLDWLRGPELDLPHARWVAEIATRLEPEAAPASPDYVRGAGATLPKLPPSPLQATWGKS